MRNKETGEFELLVGDSQLLSALVIVVLLLGVVFAMGYVVGRNSPRSDKQTEASAASTPESRPQASQPASVPPPSLAEPTPTPQPPAQTAAEPTPAPQPATQPAAKEASIPPAKAEPVKPEPPAAKAEPKTAASGEVKVTREVAAGRYVQAGSFSTEKAALVLAGSLHRHGLPAMIESTDNFRILVGPYPDLARANEIKALLRDKFGVKDPAFVARPKK